MIRLSPAFVLVALLCLPSFAHGEPLRTAIDSLHARGYPSPLAAVARLQAVQDRPDDKAPLAQRHLYQAAIGSYAA